jgi:hypothetical protein
MANATGIMGVVGSRPMRQPAPLPRSQVIRTTFQKTVSYAQRRDGNVTTVTVTTNLGGAVYYHWYLDGIWVAVTTSNQYSFVTAPDEQARIECIPTQDPRFDYVTNAPATPAARVTLWWIRSTDSDVKEYKVEQQKDAGGWSTIATVPYQAGAWDYRITSPRLDDLGSYEWRVTPVDAAGNEGSATSLDARTIVRTPDAPDFAVAFDEGTTKVTFSEAA